jgi:uncharacterized protein (DUF697 family)
LPHLLLSPSRRWAAAGALVALGAFLVLAFGRSDGSSAEAVSPRGNVSACTALTGEAARACYAREVGRELAALGGSTGGAPRALAAATTNTVTFAAGGDTSAALLCDLHLRVGVTDLEKASWTSWSTQ